MTWPTHAVTNQVPDLAGYNLFHSDVALREGLEREGGGWHAGALDAFGAELGQAEVLALAELANRHEPELQTHDRRGHRADAVEFHPAWHRLLSLLRSQGLQALPFAEPRAGSHVARAAGYYLQAQVESGSLCPATMTFASIPVLQNEPALFAELGPKLYAREHDERDLPIAQKRAIMIGMGMTEKQGGSDVRTNATVARPVKGEGRGGEYLLTGHKWFFSAPQIDAHLVLAKTDKGLSCFFVPRWRPDGSKNTVLVQRLKEKLGNRSNASSEVEFQDAWGVMVGEEGRGVPTIIEMANHTRLDCVIGSAALMRASLVQAIHHARHRSAFGKLLIQQPVMQGVLADLALESEAATWLMLRTARAFEFADDPLERAWRRIMTPAAKFWVCKRALSFTGEAMEVWGGNGYVENGPMARMYREAPVNSIWEGSGNVMCLDVLRAIEREPDAFRLLLAEFRRQLDGEALLAARLAALESVLTMPHDLRESRARRLVEDLVLVAQMGLMREGAPENVAREFIASRTDAHAGRVYGTITGASMFETLIERAFPAASTANA